MSQVRRPVAAGLFYPGHPELLRRSLDALLQAHPTLGSRPRALALPPGGLARAGAAIAAACRLLQAASAVPKRIYLTAMSPHAQGDGPTFTGQRQFATPLGRVSVDSAGVDRLQDSAGGILDDQAHALEHRLEAPLPYFQHALPPFQLVPVLWSESGGASPAIGRVLQWALDDRDGLLVVVDPPQGLLTQQLCTCAQARGLSPQPVRSGPEGDGPTPPLAQSFH